MKNSFEIGGGGMWTCVILIVAWLGTATSYFMLIDVVVKKELFNYIIGLIAIWISCFGLASFSMYEQKLRVWYKRIIFSILCGPLAFIVNIGAEYWDWLVTPKPNIDTLSMSAQINMGLGIESALTIVYRKAWQKGFCLALALMLSIIGPALVYLIRQLVN